MKKFCILFITIICCWNCASVYAKTAPQKESIKYPCFVATNTTNIEIKKITRLDDQTRVEAIIYDKPGNIFTISPQTYLYTDTQRFTILNDSMTFDKLIATDTIPQSGELHTTFLFAPIPKGIHSVNFTNEEKGWTIWDLQLTDIEPYVFLPSFLKNTVEKQQTKLPDPILKNEKVIINGYLLGYDPQIELNVFFYHTNWLNTQNKGESVKIREDGSFHIESNFLSPSNAMLRINNATLNFFVTQGEEMTIYIHLPRLSMSHTRLQKNTYAQQQKAWFDGKEENLNNELATWGYPLSITQTDNYEKNTKNLSAEAYKTYLYKTLKSVENSLANNKNIGEVYRNYVLANLKVSATVLCAEKGLPISTIDDPYLYYTSDYAAYLNFIERDKGLLPAFWKDIKRAKSVYQYWLEQSKLNSDTKDSLHAIDNQEIKAYVEENMQKRQAISNQIKSAHGYVIAELDTTVSGSDILPAIISQHRGKAILIDFWATWCTPCMKSMKAILPLKKELSARDVVYIYITGPSSPFETWESAITEIKGIHYRVTKAQWDALCKTYGIKGIPGYLIISYDGKLQDQYVGFPGTTVLKEDLLRAFK